MSQQIYNEYRQLEKDLNDLSRLFYNRRDEPTKRELKQHHKELNKLMNDLKHQSRNIKKEFK